MTDVISTPGTRERIKRLTRGFQLAVGLLVFDVSWLAWFVLVDPSL